MIKSCDHIILVLGDQLSVDGAALRSVGVGDAVVVMAEVRDEATYVPHHKKKLAFIFAAMRHFADRLSTEGWDVRYTAYDDPENKGSIQGELERRMAETGASHVTMIEPGEYRLRRSLKDWASANKVDLAMLDDDRFVASRHEFERWVSDRKQLRMEYFYREMRRKTGLLMQGAEPEGGQWNFDAENRKPARDDLFMPRPVQFEPDSITKQVLKLIESEFPDNFGHLEPFGFAVTPDQAEAAMEAFVRDALPNFGDYQDAMLEGEPFLYHSLLALYLNVGLLDPLRLCRRVERAFYEGKAPLNAVEGYIRQIIGWREYVRGIYWLKMPKYTDENYLEASRPLPWFYWSAETEMACLAAAIGQTRAEAYAHHIQRLMVTGNFAMLAGINPKEVHEWYLAVYVDAFEWVEAPNTIGMSQFADGGLLGSKPYASSGNYINKMSDYCKGCSFDVNKKHGKGCCPFNPLYWDFLVRNREKLGRNPRLQPVYRTWDKMAPETQVAYRQSAAAFLETLS